MVEELRERAEIDGQAAELDWQAGSIRARHASGRPPSTPAAESGELGTGVKHPDRRCNTLKNALERASKE
jgi:hypothetical protein